MARLLGMSLSRARSEIPANELACWLEVARREKNEISLETLYLHDLAWHLYQLRRAWSSGLPNLEYTDLKRSIVYRPAEPNAPAGPAKQEKGQQTADAQKSILCGWLGINLGNEVMR